MVKIQPRNDEMGVAFFQQSARVGEVHEGAVVAQHHRRTLDAGRLHAHPLHADAVQAKIQADTAAQHTKQSLAAGLHFKF